MVDSTGLPPDLDISEDEDLTKPRLDRAFSWIATKIRGLESFTPSWVKEVETLRAFGLARINEAIMPAYQRVMNLASFGFLRADSNTRAAFAVGSRYVLVIAEGPQRALFTPTAFVTVTRVSTPDDWAIGSVTSYDAESGRLTVDVVGAQVSPGEHDDWQITATAGSVAAAVALLASTRAARDAALQLKADTTVMRDAAVVAKNAAEKAAKDANTAALLIEGGPVASVNGRTGNIKLAESDIPGLTDKLSSMAVAVTVADALALKADKTSVENSLKLKLDKTAFDLFSQDNATTHTNLYQVKADATWVTNALANKRDTGNRLDLSRVSLFDPGNGNLDFYVDGSYRAHLQSDGNLLGPVYAGGSVTSHVESRCDAYRTDTRNWTSAWFVQDVRLGGWWEHQGYHVNTWLHAPNGGVTTAHWGSQYMAMVYPAWWGGRYLQFLRGGNWITVGVW